MGVTIDGTSITGATIDGVTVQEITIDGVSIWTNLPATIDDFEDGNVSEYSKNNYWDPTNNNSLSVQTSVVWHNTYALKIHTEDGGTYSCISTSGLDYYPEQGNTFYGWLRSSGQVVYLLFGMQSESGDPIDNNSGYGVLVNFDGNELKLERYDSGSPTTLDGPKSPSVSVDTWFKVRVEWGTDGSIYVSIRDQSDNEVNSLSATDNNYTSGGIGWKHYANDPGVGDGYFDYARMLS